MDDSLKIAIVLAYGYLLGSVPMAYIVARAVKGVDLRKVGSGTVGASNIWHNVGRWWILPLGAFDLFVKGLTPVLLAREVLDLGLGVQAAAGFMAVMGHDWPVFLRFQGGRGVAPIVGVLMALARIELTLFIVVSVAGWRLTNSAAVWVLLSLLLLPAWSLIWGKPASIAWLMGGILAATIVKRLTSNFRRAGPVSIPRLMWYRLVYDRDIRDRDDWVRRGPSTPQS